MLDKEKLLEHVQEQTLRDVMLKILDKADGVLKRHDVKSTDFLTPYETKAACDLLNGIQGIKYIVTGGYEEAERKALVLFPDYLDEYTVDTPIVAFEIKSTSQFEHLDHRDYLGAILGMGLKREKIGDIIVHNNTCQVVVNSGLKDYILYNLSKVGNASVKVKELKLDEITPSQIEYKQINGNVASLRLDAVLSLAFKVSRTEAQSLISKERVSINWMQVTKTSYEVMEKDIISLKGKGRVIIASIEGKTKSERIVIKLHKPI